MFKSIMKEGYRQTRFWGIIFALAAVVLGILSLMKGEAYLYFSSIFIPFIPLPILVRLMKYLSDSSETDFYGALPITGNRIIKGYILISQSYVWGAFILAILPFFIRDMIAPAFFITAKSAGLNGYITISTVWSNLFLQFLDVLISSLFITAIALFVIAMTRYAIAQFFLCVIITILPTFVIHIFLGGLSELFVNTGRSYVKKMADFTSFDTGSLQLSDGLLKSAVLTVFSICFISIGIRLIKKLRRSDVSNTEGASAILNSVVDAFLAFCLMLMGAYAALSYLIDCVFVSFYGVAAGVELDALQRYAEIRRMSSEMPWLTMMIFIAGALIVIAVSASRNVGNRKKWIPFALRFSVFTAISIIFLGTISVYYLNAARKFDIERVEYITLNPWSEDLTQYDYEYMTSGMFYHLYFEDDGKVKDDDYEKNSAAYSAAEESKAVQTFSGRIHSNLCKGNLQYYYDIFQRSESDDIQCRIIKVSEDAVHYEIGKILIDALNRDTKTIEDIIWSGTPKPIDENRCYLIFSIQVKDGFQYRRRCYLTVGEADRIVYLMERLALTD